MKKVLNDTAVFDYNRTLVLVNCRVIRGSGGGGGWGVGEASSERVPLFMLEVHEKIKKIVHMY